MTRLLTCIGVAAFLVGIMAAQGDEAYPGQHEHKEPPKGWYCVPADTAKRMETDPHACDCLGMISDPVCSTTSKDESGNEVTTPATTESSKCRVYCHKDHCTCMRLCHDTRMKTPARQLAS